MKTCTICGQLINDDDTTPSAIELVAHERDRQITKERYSPEHDDKHTKEELASAAVFYAAPEKYGEMYGFWQLGGKAPFRAKHDRIRQLVIAGALIVAEIERLQRAVADAPAAKE